MSKLDPEVLVKKRRKGMCAVKFCRNTVGPTDGIRCARCRKRLSRQRNPVRALFTDSKAHAKARHIGWELTFEEFERVVADMDITVDRREKSALQLDRIDATKPYKASNVRVITTTQNTIKGNRERHLPAYVLYKRMIAKQQQEDDEVPF